MTARTTESCACSHQASAYLEYGSFEYLDGSYENQFKNGGYRPVHRLHEIVRAVGDLESVLNCEVVGVRYLSDRQQLLVTVRQPDGTEISTIACEHMIWTSSLGFLKENFHSIFADEPDLNRAEARAPLTISDSTR